MFIHLQDLPAGLLLTAGMIYSIAGKKLTPAAAFTGLASGILLYCGAGYPGLIMLTAFFLFGSIATSLGKRKKEGLKKTEDAVMRKPGQVLANSGTATLMAVLMLIFPEYHHYLLIMLSGSLASATADTLSSELGMIYGSTFYNCLSWKKEAAGLDGVISLEGTLIGAGGALLIAIIYGASEGFTRGGPAIVIGGIAGNFSDSVFGAALERRHKIGNDGVNFLSTVFAAGVSLLLPLILGL